MASAFGSEAVTTLAARVASEGHSIAMADSKSPLRSPSRHSIGRPLT